MDLFLHRTHYRTGTNGGLFHRNRFLCFSIELPWHVNQHNISCIPDGTYELEIFYSIQFKHHLLVKGVPQRSGILILPANDVLNELGGCIAPVSQLTGIGKGLGSRKALDLLILRIEAFREPGEAVFLTICSEHCGR
ncbi:DUF5675 family protein [Aequorivita todarodis]|uniref:DUF5675 family protein n=1 Tax=Aequorivita todarodis TaxID=2036821 RepID=UPI00235063D3|nr:DUF5675 family protein [Aequorivita todarodis]MDC8000119.1 DUF5675 family protein [Aequorivita todarodis]